MITLRQIMAMAKVATNPDKKFIETIRKILFRNGTAVVTDTYILFEKRNSGIEGIFTLNADEISKKIKIKDNAKVELTIQPGKINNTEIKESDMVYVDYESIIPKTTFTEVKISKHLLEKMLNCFEENILTIKFAGDNKPIIFQGENELGLIMPIEK